MADSVAGNDKFVIVGATTEFGSRSRDIFATLETIAAKHSAFESTPAARRESAALMKPDPGEEELAPSLALINPSFRIPVPPPAKKFRSSLPSNTPGFKAEPSKWTAYDLSDIADSQMSERSNQGAALEFIEARRRSTAMEASAEPHSVTEPVRHTFRKPTRDVSDEDLIGVGRRAEQARLKRIITVAADEDIESDEEPNSVDGNHRITSREVARPEDDVCDEQTGGKQPFFHHCKSRRTKAIPNVRGKQVTQSDSEDEEGDKNKSNGVAIPAGTTVDSDSDDFSELAAGPDSEDDPESDADECYVSDMGVVTGGTRTRLLATENDESNSGLDGID